MALAWQTLAPDIRPEWVLYDQDGILAIDKPAGVSSQAADADAPDDIVARLRSWLGPDAYVGVHQRLDQETSGVLVFVRDPARNAAVARAFETRTATKEYIAAVVGWQGGARTLRHRLKRSRGRVFVAKGKQDGKEAITHVEVLERRGNRHLLRLKIETGRTHQIRVQLAESGAPIVGDAMYGGAPASRLFLHAQRLQLPLDDTPSGSGSSGSAVLDLASPVPAEFSEWLKGEASPYASLDRLLRRALDRRWILTRAAMAGETTCFRWIDADGDGLPGVEVDLYGGHAVLHLKDDAAPHEEALLDAIERAGVPDIYVKRRPLHANLARDEVDTIAPPEPVRGAPAPAELAVREYGVEYHVRLGDGLGTGLFLDAREARHRVLSHASDQRVLNLFAYCGGFSIAAAAAGATEVLSVDGSRTYLDRARSGVQHIAPTLEHRVWKDDCFEVLARLVRREDRFGLVICDPPTHSTSKKHRWRSGRGWVQLLEDCFAVCEPGGHVLACSNDARMTRTDFRRFAEEAAEKARLRIRIGGVGRSVDLPRRGNDHPFKKLWITLTG